MSSPFLSYLVQYYPEVKRQYPEEGRRRWRLRVAQQFWQRNRESLFRSPSSANLHQASENVDFVSDTDPLDEISIKRSELGLIVRTDFSDEGAWTSFCGRLAEGESEYAVESSSRDVAPDDDQELTECIAVTEDSSSDGSDDEGILPPVFYVINPSTPYERALLENISNLTALRLLNDVDVRGAPSLPQGTKPIRTPNRLVDLNKWQEIYLGKNIWVYDSKSNVDQCVRLVSQSGDMYGTATGDSWRARVSHICELQVSLFSGQIKIDFGGLDRWDFTERQRNMAEAEQVGGM